MPTHGLRPGDVVTDGRGNVIAGAVLEFYTTDTAAMVGTGPIGSATTDGHGRWVFVTDYPDDIWARTVSGQVYRLAIGAATVELPGPISLAKLPAGSQFTIDWSGSDWVLDGDVITSRPSGLDHLRMVAYGGSSAPSFQASGDIWFPAA